MIFVSRRVEQMNLSVQLYALAFVYDMPFYYNYRISIRGMRMVKYAYKNTQSDQSLNAWPHSAIGRKSDADPGIVSSIPAPYFCGD